MMNATNTRREISTEKWAAMCGEHCGWVKTIARKYAWRFASTDIEDLMQEGFLAIGRALETYDASQGAFLTYLTPWLHAYMGLFCKNNCASVRLPVHRWTRPLLADLKDARNEADPNATEDEIKYAACQRRMPQLISFDAPAHDHGSETIGDTIPAPVQESPAMDDDRAAVLTRFLNGLSEEDRELFRLHFGLDCEPQVLDELAKRYGISREGVRVRMTARIAEFRRWRSMNNANEPVRLGGGRGQSKGVNRRQPCIVSLALPASSLTSCWQGKRTGRLLQGWRTGHDWPRARECYCRNMH